MQCLKESYIKALGIGIYSDLDNLDFKVSSDQFSTSSDSTLLVGGWEQTHWVFEESWLDDDHIVVVCEEVIE